MSDWTTLASVKIHVNLDGDNTDLDAKIAALIPPCSRMLEAYIGRSLDLQDYTEYYDGDGMNEVLVGYYPVNSIASIYIDPLRVFGADTLVNPTYYTYNANNNENVGLIRLFQGLSYFSKGIQNVKITYNSGFASIPTDAALACNMLVAWHLARSGAEGFTAASLGGKAESYDPNNLPIYIRNMVNKYKKFSA